jgi:hemerythrin-like domain-containing protein
MLDRLRNQHELLRTFARDLRGLIASEQPANADVLAAARWRLSRMLLQHLSLEERYVYRPLERDPRPEVNMIAHGFSRELDDSFARYQEHMHQWTPERISRDWHCYRRAARHLIDFLFERLDREERDLYPMINEEADIALRSPRDRNWAGQGFVIREKIGQTAQAA